MSELTRRGFLVGSAGVATGAALFSGPLAATAAKSSKSSKSSKSKKTSNSGHADASAANGAVVYVRDAAQGGVLLMVGEYSIELTDHSLVEAVSHAMKQGRS